MPTKSGEHNHPPELIDACRKEFVAGAKLTVIAKARGIPQPTIRSWSHRFKWASSKVAVLESLTNSQGKSILALNADSAVQHQLLIQRVIQAKIDSISKLDPHKASDHAYLATALKNLDDIGRRNVGLSLETDSPKASNVYVNVDLSKQGMKRVEKTIELDKNHDTSGDKASNYM